MGGNMDIQELETSTDSAIGQRRKKRPILDYFPYSSPRQEQLEILTALETHWNNYDCFIIVAPTALGKSSLAKTVGCWAGNTSIITPTNILVEQMHEEFSPAISKLQKRALYKCPRVAGGRLSCEDANKQFGGRKRLGCNRECAYLRDLQRAHSRGVGVFNYYTYLAHKIYRPTLIIDEAHNVIPMIQDLSAIKMWKHDYKYPYDMWNYADILAWLEGCASDGMPLDENMQGLKTELTSSAPRYVIKRDREMWNRTTPPEEREMLKMLPIDIKDAPPHLWPNRVKKMIMMSATISRKDVEELGLGRRRVLYLEASSPIPPTQRPLYYKPIANVNRNSMERSTLEIAKWIEGNLLEKYRDVKGVIHATYAQAKMLRKVWGDNARFIFHSKTDTKERYADFLEALPSTGKVLVASGLYEGIDLVEDLGRWQALIKIPWPSLGDPAIKHKCDNDPEWYAWACLKTVMQSAGRICRGPTDFGESYILDGTFQKLYKQSKQYNLVPKWFEEALIFE
jgi:Rad3-related DNA helicase